MTLLHRGKVRETYAVGEDRLLLVATDRLSAFDHVLPNPIPDKGKVLTGLSVFLAWCAWGLVGESVKENNTVENLARLITAAKDGKYGVFVSPHYLYPHDQAWQFGGIVEHMMLDDREFFRPDRSRRMFASPQTG